MKEEAFTVTKECALSVRFLSLAVLGTASKHLWIGVCLLIVIDSVETNARTGICVVRREFLDSCCAGVQEKLLVLLLSLAFSARWHWASHSGFQCLLDFFVYKMRMLITASIRGDMEPLRFRAQTCPMKALMKLIFYNSKKGKYMVIQRFILLTQNFVIGV